MSVLRWRDGAVAAVAAALFVTLAAADDRVWSGTVGVSDTPVYARYGEAIAAGAVPYRDLRVEYPPGALPAFVLPALAADDSRDFSRAFAVQMVAWGVLTIASCAALLAGLGATAHRWVLGLGAVAASPLLLGGLLLTRFDLYPAALAVGSLAALVWGRERLGAGLLGAGIVAKLYPAVLLPLLVAWTWRRRGRRQALVALGISAAVVVAAFAPFVVLSADGVWWSVERQLSRPLQIESLGAAVLLALHHAAGMPLDWESSHGSQNLTGWGAVTAAAVTSVLQAAALAWLWLRFARGRVDAERLVRFAAAVLVAFVALGKVLSPQFLVWLLPVVSLVGGAAGVSATGLLLAACLLTRTWFPSHYWALVKEFHERSSWYVLLRDLALVGALGVLAGARRLSGKGQAVRARARAAARSPSHARSPGRT